MTPTQGAVEDPGYTTDGAKPSPPKHSSCLLFYRKLCPLSEGRMVVQCLCSFQPQWGLVPRGPLPEPIPGWSLLGRIPRRILLTQESGDDDSAQPQHLPLSLPPSWPPMAIARSHQSRPSCADLKHSSSPLLSGWEDRMLDLTFQITLSGYGHQQCSLSFLLSFTPASLISPGQS